MYILFDFIGVIESDFGMMKKVLEKWDPTTAQEGVITSRLFVIRFKSRMLQKIDELVLKELIAQKAEDLEILIWKVKTKKLEHLMLGLVVGTLQNPNQLDLLEKLKRIEKCLCDVISDGRVFILTHRFMSQPEFFPVVQVSQSMEQ